MDFNILSTTYINKVFQTLYDDNFYGALCFYPTFDDIDQISVKFKLKGFMFDEFCVIVTNTEVS